MTQQATNLDEFRAFNRARRVSSGSPSMRVVHKADLAHEDEGAARGWAHIGFEGYRPQAPGRLDFDPLLLFAEGMMHEGEGFAMHRHESVENVLLILDGCVEHRGSDGSHWSLERDDVFLMSAGSGGEHEEFARAETHALVIWLRSAEPDTPCRFDRANVPWRSTPGFCVLASGGSRRAGGLELRRDAAVLRADLEAGCQVTHELTTGRRAYLIALEGAVSVNEQVLEPGERIMAEGPGSLRIRAADRSRVVLVDMDSRNSASAQPGPGPQQPPLRNRGDARGPTIGDVWTGSLDPPDRLRHRGGQPTGRAERGRGWGHRGGLDLDRLSRCDPRRGLELGRYRR